LKKYIQHNSKEYKRTNEQPKNKSAKMSGVILSETCPVCYDHYHHEGNWKKTKMVLGGCSHSVCKDCSNRLNYSCPCCRAPYSSTSPAEVDADDEMMIMSDPVETIKLPDIIRYNITEVGYDLEELMDIIKNKTYQDVIMNNAELQGHFTHYYTKALELYKLLD